jgi:hypothetical protein
VEVVRGVVGDWLAASSVGLDGVDLIVASGDGVSIGYAFAVWSVVGPFVGRGVVCEWLLASSTGIDGINLEVLYVVARIGTPTATATSSEATAALLTIAASAFTTLPPCCTRPVPVPQYAPFT